MTGIYSAYNYAERSVAIIANFSRTRRRLLGEGEPPATGMFLYQAWHSTHVPLQCPPEWMYPPLPANNNSDPNRMTYNCMVRIQDDGIGNLTAALKVGGLWEGALVMWAADNGGWVDETGSNNYPLKGSKTSDFEGGVRAVSLLSGGYLPATVRGTTHRGYISIADWYGTLCVLTGVSPRDDVPGLPPVDSNDFWPSILTPNATSSGRTELFLSWSCHGSSADASGCAPDEVSVYNTSGDPTHGESLGNMALISGRHKIIIGEQAGRGVWFGPV
eukprot:SAG22_NODE_1784_length_3588_cov_27.751791_2_plen_274_part_00